jgi:hypothetical protein
MKLQWPVFVSGIPQTGQALNCKRSKLLFMRTFAFNNSSVLLTL